MNTKTLHYHESIGNVDIETIVKEVNNLFAPDKNSTIGELKTEDDSFIQLNSKTEIKLTEKTTIKSLVNQILSRKKEIIDGLVKNLQIDITNSNNLSDSEFFTYLIVYLKTRTDIIDKDQIQELRDSFSHYITETNKDIYRMRVENNIYPNSKTTIGDEPLAYIEEKTENPIQTKVLLEFLNKYPKQSKNMVKLINGTNNIIKLTEIIYNCDQYNLNDILNEVEDVSKFIELIRDVKDVLIITKLISNNASKFIELINNIKSINKLTELLNNVLKITELIDGIDEAIKLSELINNINNIVELINKMVEIEDFIKIVNGCEINNIIEIINKDNDKFILKINKFNVSLMIEAINKGKLPSSLL